MQIQKRKIQPQEKLSYIFSYGYTFLTRGETLSQKKLYPMLPINALRIQKGKIEKPKKYSPSQVYNLIYR